MVANSIQVAIGALLSSLEACAHFRCSNSPFVTKIGVGKVIKGWDEGEKRRDLSSNMINTIDIGVPQLSVGEKAILTITSDYVSSIPFTCFVLMGR
jgi:hypothetical protein